MAPYKYEEEFKNKLEKRSLQPSVNAWEKLSNRLEKEEKQTNKKLYWWLGVAASLVGVALITTQFFNTGTGVKIDDETIEIVTQQEELQLEKIDDEVIVDNDNKEEPVNKKYVKKAQKVKKLKPAILTKVTNTAVAKVDSIDEIKTITPIQPKALLSFEEQKIQTVVAQIKILNESQQVTEADIDALLKQAQRDIQLSKLINSETGVVDANSLLQDVEAELDQTFRMRVFEAIKDSYVTVKTAVAQRNE
ncbi:hypothetical protein [Neotamlana laminarinivorans]|uniref:Uncharacterized protein n=1 Tax=Neotamlana laminarinivorans TaxID=2883124 RepID=A0A9X1L1F5_9FLAO|nr:hypothetical protein [Tamlana laminarinivorans]MCB4798673.1 hypothetical protein [Tamlana laminarinivorans]